MVSIDDSGGGKPAAATDDVGDAAALNYETAVDVSGQQQACESKIKYSEQMHVKQ